MKGIGHYSINIAHSLYHFKKVLIIQQIACSMIITFANNPLMNFVLAFIEEDSILLYFIGFLGTIITTVYLITKVLVNKDPIIEILNSYKMNPKFSELQFKINENNTIIGNINDLNIELMPKLNGESDLNFLLIIDLSNKPYYNNHVNLKYAFGRHKFEQIGSKVILNKWEPRILNYGNFNRVLDKLREHINKIESRTSFNKKV